MKRERNIWKNSSLFLSKGNSGKKIGKIKKNIFLYLTKFSCSKIFSVLFWLDRWKTVIISLLVEDFLLEF